MFQCSVERQKNLQHFVFWNNVAKFFAELTQELDKYKSNQNAGSSPDTQVNNFFLRSSQKEKNFLWSCCKWKH